MKAFRFYSWIYKNPLVLIVENIINSFSGIIESASSGSLESLGVSRVLKISDENLQKFKFYF